MFELLAVLPRERTTQGFLQSPWRRRSRLGGWGRGGIPRERVLQQPRDWPLAKPLQAPIHSPSSEELLCERESSSSPTHNRLSPRIWSGPTAFSSSSSSRARSPSSCDGPKDYHIRPCWFTSDCVFRSPFRPHLGRFPPHTRFSFSALTLTQFCRCSSKETGRYRK